MLYGSLAALDRTIKILHVLGCADSSDGRDPIPVPPGGAAGATSSEETAIAPTTQCMVIMTKTVLLE